jgi:hypothetical protein
MGFRFFHSLKEKAMKFSIDQLRDMLRDLVDNKQEKKKRIRISITLDSELLDEINRQSMILRYVSRNEFITSALAQFCSEGE